MNREQAMAGIRQVDERIRQADERMEELARQFDEVPLEEWCEALVADGMRELTDREKDLLERTNRIQSQQEQVKDELRALLDEKDVFIRELSKSLPDPEERAKICKAWEKERIEKRKSIDPEDVIDISEIQIVKKPEEPSPQADRPSNSSLIEARKGLLEFEEKTRELKTEEIQRILAKQEALFEKYEQKDLDPDSVQITQEDYLTDQEQEKLDAYFRALGYGERLDEFNQFLENPGKETVAGEYSPEELEALSSFARTGNLKSLIPFAVKEQARNEGAAGQSGVLSNPLGAMVLNCLTAEADGERRGLLGRSYLKRNTLMKKSCELKGENLLFGAAAQLDWSEFSEQGREDYDNGNYGRAVRCLELSVEKLLKKGEDVLDSRTAKQWLLEECRLLADIYLEGKGMSAASPERAVSYLRIAVEQAQDTEAAYRIGVLYAEGKSISANPEQARKYMTMAANQGHVRAGTYLAEAMLLSREWAKNLYSESRVLSCLDAGIRSGDRNAAFFMGILCCIQGRLDDAITWLEKVSDWDMAGVTLGEIYFKQGNYQKAVPYLKKGCDVQGYKYGWEYTINSHVQENHKFVRLSECMGQCYARSLGGCEKDSQKAKIYLEDAVVHQGVQAQTYHDLVMIYLWEGDLGPDKAEKVLQYWLKTQELGSSWVPINLGANMIEVLKNSGTDARKKGLVSRCAERLNQLAKEGNPEAKYEYCAYLVSFSPYQEGDWSGNKVWYYSDGGYFRGYTGSHVINSSDVEQYLDEALGEGIFLASYVKGRHYMKLDKIGNAYECYQKGAAAGDSRARKELPYFKKTLLGYKYQR